MVIFHSYVSLPEGISLQPNPRPRFGENGKLLKVTSFLGSVSMQSKCPSSNVIEIIEEVNALEPAMAADPNDLIVRDGPLTQPFMDYVFDTGGIRRWTWFNRGLEHENL